jgi:hypothetical protein
MATDYQRLRIARDLAAYRAVGHIDAAICYCRQGDAKMALAILMDGRALYQKAADALDQHTTSSPKKENTSERTRSAA